MEHARWPAMLVRPPAQICQEIPSFKISHISWLTTLRRRITVSLSRTLTEMGPSSSWSPASALQIRHTSGISLLEPSQMQHSDTQHCRTLPARQSELQLAMWMKMVLRSYTSSTQMLTVVAQGRVTSCWTEMKPACIQTSSVSLKIPTMLTTSQVVLVRAWTEPARVAMVSLWQTTEAPCAYLRCLLGVGSSRMWHLTQAWQKPQEVELSSLARC
mmetsp:Transcript_76489/g.198837  ORF Transcript_76489/g.198837 Transcript_76489/m.198837 type:complete len:215 (-) Transcript_76489:679-1323(-)